MGDFELVLNLNEAHVRVAFEDADDLERKLEELDLPRVADLIDGALARFPHPPGREGFMRPPSSPG